MLYLHFQSLDDWTLSRNLLQCNEQFHGSSRYDWILLDSDSDALEIARLCALLRCTLPSGTILDLAMVHHLTPCKWSPKTKWNGCCVYRESKKPSLITMDSVLRGVLMAPVTDGGSETKDLFYLVDCIDSDIFLRAGN